jgi:hypothetical protein
MSDPKFPPGASQILVGNEGSIPGIDEVGSRDGTILGASEGKLVSVSKVSSSPPLEGLVELSVVVGDPAGVSVTSGHSIGFMEG